MEVQVTPQLIRTLKLISTTQRSVLVKVTFLPPVYVFSIKLISENLLLTFPVSFPKTLRFDHRYVQSGATNLPGDPPG